MNQSELIGLGLAYVADRADKAIKELNEARAMCALPPVTLLIPAADAAQPGEMQPKKRMGRPPKHTYQLPGSNGSANPSVHMQEILPLPADGHSMRRTMSAKTKSVIGEQNRQAWAIIREAGIKRVGRPSKADVARGLKIIAKRKEKEERRAALASIPVEEVPLLGATKTHSRLTEAGKARLQKRGVYRWAIVREAGIHMEKMPTNDDVARAERIVAARRRRAELADAAQQAQA